MSDLKESPSQTAGPYVQIGCLPKLAGLQGPFTDADRGSVMCDGSQAGEAMSLVCRVYDGSGALVTDAMLEIWQAGPDGAFAQTKGFSNWGRGASDPETAAIEFKTLKPGAVGDQAPHILVWIVARGINLGLTTRIYFEDEDGANAADPVFQLAGARAATLVAKLAEGGYQHDIYLQGDLETVFFDV